MSAALPTTVAPVTLTLTITPAAPARGQTVTAAYVVNGNTGTPPTAATVTGQANVGGQTLDVATTLTIPGVDPLPESFAAPTCTGLSFVTNGDRHVWTAVVP